MVSISDWSNATASLAGDRVTILLGGRQPAFDVVQVAFHLHEANKDKIILAHTQNDLLLASASPISWIFRSETPRKTDDRLDYTKPPSRAHAMDRSSDDQDERAVQQRLPTQEDGDIDRPIEAARKNVADEGKRALQVWNCSQIPQSLGLHHQSALLAVHLATGSKIWEGGLGETNIHRCADLLEHVAESDNPLEVLLRSEELNSRLTTENKTNLRYAFRVLSESTEGVEVVVKSTTPDDSHVAPVECDESDDRPESDPFLLGFAPDQVAFSEKSKTSDTRSKPLCPNGEDHIGPLHSGVGSVSPI